MLSKNVINKKCAPKMVFFNEKKSSFLESLGLYIPLHFRKSASLQLNYEFEHDIATVDLTKIKEQEK